MRGLEPRTPCLQSRYSSQLSYIPFSISILVGLPGLEPGTSSLSVTRSNQLSYKPDYCVIVRIFSCISNIFKK